MEIIINHIFWETCNCVTRYTPDDQYLNSSLVDDYYSIPTVASPLACPLYPNWHTPEYMEAESLYMYGNEQNIPF